MTEGCRQNLVVLASGNTGKLKEIGQALASFGLELRPQDDYGVSEAVEDGSSFVENAIIKARHAAAATGLSALADDSGLMVEALGGRPGVHSARYAGEGADDEMNVRLLLDEMEGEVRRDASFVCVLALVRSADDPMPLIAQGRWNGRIATRRAGANGFGYDPVFIDPIVNMTAAQMEAKMKRQRSHRALALLELKEELRNADFQGV